GVELLGDAVGLHQPGTARASGARGLVGPLLAPQLHSVLVGESLDRLHERQAVDLLQEADRVAALTTAEAVPHLAGRVDVERRGLLVVEGAEPLEGARTGTFEGDVGRDHVVDARLVAHLGDVVVTDPASHGGESTAAPRTPAGGAGGASSPTLQKSDA